MARAAVKAKQQAKKAQAQPAKPARGRGRRGHSGGGNPNQQLFFMRLRRGQRWLYALLAVVFAVTFAGVGVGSGNSGGLSQLYTGLFGGGGNPVSKAQDEVKKNPVKGYLDLARAYETKSDTAQAITAFQSYLALKKKDANVWSELGGLELSQARTYAGQYQQAQQSAQLADPSQAFLPGGTLATAVGANAAFQQAAQQATTLTSTLYQKATTALSAAVSDYQKAANLQPHSASAQQQLATASENAGNFKLAVSAWRKYLKLYPASPERAAVKAQIKRDKQALAASAAATSTPKVKTHK
jgi:tetratricopeptide (TPR) repeat protein